MKPVRPALAQAERDAAVAQKYRHLRPVHFPYPEPDRLSKVFGAAEYAQAAASEAEHGSTLRLALCAPATARTSDAARCHAGLRQEIAMVGALFGGRGPISQWDFGGAPRLFSDAQLVQLIDRLHKSFTVAVDAAGAFSISLDASASCERVVALRGLGFNELGIELAPRSPERQTVELMASARGAGYRAVQLIIAAGGERHNEFGLARCLRAAERLGPDRILLEGQELQSLHARLLADAGYRHAGADLFVRRDSDAAAQFLGGTRRFPQGDCRFAGSSLVGIGPAAISMLGPCCSQNACSVDEYCRRIAACGLPVARGAILNRDQLLRRAVMQMLLCDFELSVEAIEQVFAIDFDRYFRRELEVLQGLQEDGLLIQGGGSICIQEQGRPLARQICAVFAAAH